MMSSRAVEDDVSSRLNAHATAIGHNEGLAARVAAVYAARYEAGLNAEQIRLVETTHGGFLCGGSALAPADKVRFAAIDARLGALSVESDHHVLAATGAWILNFDAEDLAGLPPSLRDAVAGRVTAREAPGRYHVTLDRSAYESFLTYSARRDRREQLWRAFTNRCDSDVYDNWPLISETLALRRERATLLGYADYVHYALEDRMAHTATTANALLMQLWQPGKRRAIEEAAELQSQIDEKGGGFVLAPWYWRYYAERVRRSRYALDGTAVAQHLRLDALRQAAFETAEKRYGLRFVRRADIAGYHPDVICPLLIGPETMIVWTTKGALNADQEAQAGRDYREAA